MRYSIALSAIVALALADKHHGNHHQKLHQKRDVVIETEVKYVYQTVIVTDIIDGPSPTAITTKVVESSLVAIPTSVEIVHQQFGASGGESSSATSAQASSEPASESSAGPTAAHIPVPSGIPDLYQETCLLHHNVHRANHSVPALTWSDQLASWAQEIASTCVFQHAKPASNPSASIGQNIAAGVSADDVAMAITSLFYNGEINSFDDQYGVPNPIGFEAWGHFSQMVWASTTEFACATVDCSATGLADAPGESPLFTVCNYSPPGNMDGAYGTEINAPLGHATIDWNIALSSI